MKKAISIAAFAITFASAPAPAHEAPSARQLQHGGHSQPNVGHFPRPVPATYPVYGPRPGFYPRPVPVVYPVPVTYPVAVPVPVVSTIPFPVAVPTYATRCLVPGIGWVWMARGVFLPIGSTCTAVDAYGRPWAGIAE